MRLVRFQSEYQDHFINADFVIYLEPLSDGQTSIFFMGGGKIVVEEGIEAAAERVRGLRTA